MENRCNNDNVLIFYLGGAFIDKKFILLLPIIAFLWHTTYVCITTLNIKKEKSPITCTGTETHTGSSDRQHTCKWKKWCLP